MESCIAPSEVPGIFKRDFEVFGKIAEDIIYADFLRRYGYPLTQIYVDDNNEGAYLMFLHKFNPHLNLMAFASVLRMKVLDDEDGPELGIRRPDLIIHTPGEQVFYEIKPDSNAGRRKGMEKVGVLSASYRHFDLPYKPGYAYSPARIKVASIAGQLTVNLSATLEGPGLILYKLCFDSTAIFDISKLTVLLRYIIMQMNKQQGTKVFKPIDLRPALAREGELRNLAYVLGLSMTAAAATVGWKFFWKAVAKRFAARGATAALLAAADGPLPVGDLLAAGMAIWTIIDVIRLSNELWNEAGAIAKQEMAA